MKKIYFYDIEKETCKEQTDYENCDMTAEEISEYIVEVMNDYKPVGDAYIDNLGFLHLCENGVDRTYGYLFSVEDDDWTEITGKLGQLLDDHDDNELNTLASTNPKEYEKARKIIEKIYKYAVNRI